MIDKVFNDSLKARFAPKGSVLYNHQTRLLEMLIYIDNICRKNNINYWLSSGTALGAARHNGFIPWDDDIDIEMTYKDYIKFEKIMLNDVTFAIQTRHTDDFYAAPYAKVRDKKSIIQEHNQDTNYKYKGIYIDVFIIERNPSLFLSAFFSRIIWNLVLESGKANTTFRKHIYKLKKTIIYAMRDFFRIVLMAFPCKQYRHTLGGGFSRNVRYMNEIFPLKEVLFEGHLFMAPGNLDEYLTRIYGDYMTLPDLDNIHPHVSNVIFLNE